MSELDLEFFSGAYNTTSYDKDRLEKINNGILKDLTYTDYRGVEQPALKTMGRNTSRANLAIMYGMSKGYTYEELTEKSADGANLRSRIGKEFISEVKVMSYDEFANKSQVEKNDVTRDAYNKYLLERFQNIEKVCANSYDALIKQPITRLDPSNHREFTDNFIKQYALGKMAMDFSQSYDTLQNNFIAPTDPDAQRVTNRAGAVFEFTSGKIQPFIKLQGCLESYLGYMSSDTYLREKIDNITAKTKDGIFAYCSGKAKGILSYFYNESDDMKTVDLFDENKQTTAMPKNKGTEKPLSMGGKGM